VSVRLCLSEMYLYFVVGAKVSLLEIVKFPKGSRESRANILEKWVIHNQICLIITISVLSCL